jgi:hypothetical protein
LESALHKWSAIACWNVNADLNHLHHRGELLDRVGRDDNQFLGNLP